MLNSGVARVFPGGRVAHPDDQNEEENEEIWGKIRDPTGKWGKIEEMFLSCPPGSERLATALTLNYWQGYEENNNSVFNN